MLLTITALQTDSLVLGVPHTKIMQLMRVKATIPNGSKYIDLIIKDSYSLEKLCDCTQGQNCGGSIGIRIRRLGN